MVGAEGEGSGVVEGDPAESPTARGVEQGQSKTNQGHRQQ